MTLSKVSDRGSRPTGVVRLRWWVLGATLGVLLVPVSLVAATPVGPVWPAVVVPLPEVATTSAPGGAAPVAPSGDRIPASLQGDAVLGTPVSDASTLTRSEPTRLRIPAIELDSELMALGLQHDGRMEVPPGAFPAGWYTGAPTPGELGPAILAGHVDYGGTAGVFYRLRDVEPGDTVEVTRQDGSTAVFRVTRVEQHPKGAFPTAAVYGDLDHAGLRLITCGGTFDRRVHSYEDNIIVFAVLDIGEDEGGRRG